jgi:hypothetical protein
VSGELGGYFIRAPTPSLTHPDHIGTHVAVSLEKSVREALDTASAPDREVMMQTLVDSLASQIQIQYSPNAVGQFAMDFVGTMNTLEGLFD